MENFQVFEVVWRYSTIVILGVLFIYIFSYVQVNKLRKSTPTKWSFFVSEVHVISRSLILIYIAFIFAKYMFLVESGASVYFEENKFHTYKDFFQYLLKIDFKD